MGEIPMKATRARARIEIAHAHQVLLLFFAILIIGTAMRAMTAGRIPLKILSTTGLSLNAEKTIAIIRIIKKEGIIDPRVAAMIKGWVSGAVGEGAMLAPKGVASFDFSSLLDKRRRRDKKHLKRARKILEEWDEKQTPATETNK
jgi:hypothetical protein